MRAVFKYRAVLLVLLWSAAFGAALLIDRPLAEWISRDPLDRRAWFVYVIKSPGNFLFTIAVCILLVRYHRRAWQAAVPLLIAAPLGGLAYLLLKWMVGRHRPVPEFGIKPFDFHPFARGIEGLIHAEAGLSFPSGHAALVFATALCLSAAIPRWSIAFFAMAFVVATERVLENAHYVSDVVAGAGLGILCGWIALRITERLFRRTSEASPETQLRDCPAPIGQS